MIVRMHPRSTTLDLCNVTQVEASAILRALRHEMIRSQRRMEDSRVGDETHKIERDNRRLLNLLAQTVQDYVRPTDS